METLSPEPSQKEPGSPPSFPNGASGTVSMTSQGMMLPHQMMIPPLPATPSGMNPEFHPNMLAMGRPPGLHLMGGVHPPIGPLGPMPVPRLLGPGVAPPRSVPIMHNEFDSHDGPVWIEHKTSDGQFYYSDPKTHRTVWEKPIGVNIIPFNGNNNPIPFGPGGPPVPLGIPLVPQKVWSEFKTSEGNVYYYNKVTRQSVWETPPDVDLVMPLPASLDDGPSNIERVTASSQPNDVPTTPQQLDALKPLDPPPISMAINIPPDVPIREIESEPMEINSTELLALVAAKLGTGPPPSAVPLKPAPKTEEKKGTRPIESVPIPGTPWSIVFTNDKRRFFFDATLRKSVWSMPSELENLPSVMKILENPPWRKKRVGELEEPSAKKIKLTLSQVDEEGEEEDNKQMTEITATEAEMDDVQCTSQEDFNNAEMKASELRANLPLEERQEIFKAMLLEREASAFSTWEKELPKFVFDERYQLLLPKERKQAFEEFIAARAEAEMKEKRLKVKENKEAFMKFLQESNNDRTTFIEFSRQNKNNSKFKIIEKMKERENLFNEYLSNLKKVQKQLEQDQKQTLKNKIAKEKSDFVSMLKEEDKLTEKSQWRKVKGWFQKDPRYKAIESSSRKEELFNEYIKSLNRDEKEELIAASLREREREVQMSRTEQEKQWDIERGHLMKSQAKEQFTSMLVDLVKDPTASWTETRRKLRHDYRWEGTEMIEIGDREKMFRDHVSQLAKKRRMQFRKLLEDTPKIQLTTPWKKARKYIKDHSHYKMFGDNDHTREDEYDRFLHDKVLQAKEDFHSLLCETKSITYKSKDTIRESDKHLKDIIDTLEKDQRYLILEYIKDERHQILMDYIDSLHQKGPPPPPTATHPSERVRK